jgi:hypothetical protein
LNANSLRDIGRSGAIEGDPLQSQRMTEPVAVIARTERLARSAAPHVRARLAGAPVRACSLRSFLAGRNAPRRVVLYAGGRSPAAEIGFLRRARERLLWPAPPAGFEKAVGGIRGHPAAPLAAASRRAPVRAGKIASALLMEGAVGAARARAALAAAGPRDWIVEQARRVHVPDRLLAELARAGVRWSALEPLELIALCVSPEIARARPGWRRLLPSGTPVWTRAS